ncbi:MAG: TIGR00266 family protein [Pirellulaceae bacterium]
MNVDILHQGLFATAEVTLAPGEQFVSESGALYRGSPNLNIETSSRALGGGGILSGLKRAMFARESFFMSTYASRDGSPASFGLSPTLPGEMQVVQLDGAVNWICAGGSYVGSGTGVTIDTQYQGLVKGLLGGGNLMFMKTSGTGPMLVSGFGRLIEIEVEGSLTIDNGHLVAFQDSLQFSVTKAAKGWMASFFSGEMFACRFTGKGKLIAQSHSPTAFGGLLGPRLPER